VWRFHRSLPLFPSWWNAAHLAAEKNIHLVTATKVNSPRSPCTRSVELHACKFLYQPKRPLHIRILKRPQTCNARQRTPKRHGCETPPRGDTDLTNRSSAGVQKIVFYETRDAVKDTETPAVVNASKPISKRQVRETPPRGETNAKIHFFGPSRALCHTNLIVVLFFSLSVTWLLCSQDAVNANLELIKKGHTAPQEGAQLVLNGGGQCISIFASPPYPLVGTNILSMLMIVMLFPLSYWGHSVTEGFVFVGYGRGYRFVDVAGQDSRHCRRHLRCFWDLQCSSERVTCVQHRSAVSRNHPQPCPKTIDCVGAPVQ
jgi:hypothetical protein